MNDWIRVCTVEEIPAQGARVLRQTGETDIAVFRTAADEVFALRDRCPHKGGPLSQGLVHGKTVTCPLHSWTIELDTGNARAPDTGCAGHLPVRVEAGEVFVRLGRRHG